MDDNTTDLDDGTNRGRSWLIPLLVVIATAVVVIAVLLAVEAFGDDDDATSPSTTPAVTVPATTIAPTTAPVTTAPVTTAPVTAPATTPATTAPVTTAPAPTTTATTVATTTVPPIVQVRAAIFPTPGMETTYTDPVAAARDFALAIGYADPETGEFQAGDARSGEVEVRAAPSRLTSVMFVRQLGDQDAWYVIGAATDNIEVDTPQPFEEIASPLTISGSARSFEGTVDVVLTADDVDDPLVEDFVTGSGGPDFGPFEGTFEFDPPDVEGGSLLLLSRSSDDGSVVEVSAQRVFFATE